MISVQYQGPVKTKFYILASLFAALTAAGAFIKIPFPVVPLTLQTFFVILSGVLLGPVFGAFSQVLYLTVGLMGIPVFANGGGPGYVLQPSFGYLVSYPIAAYVIGYLTWGRQRSTSPLPGIGRILFAIVCGVLVIYILGVTGLYLNLNYVVAKPTSFEHAVWIGFVIFIPSSILKIFAGALLAQKLNKYLIITSIVILN